MPPWPQVEGRRRKIERRRTEIRERMPNTEKNMFKDQYTAV
jgi:hypothetical protein